jgi:hypothetical protein
MYVGVNKSLLVANMQRSAGLQNHSTHLRKSQFQVSGEHNMNKKEGL